MPFIPLGSRKLIPVLLDHEKQTITGKMRAKDDATVKLHHQVMAGTSSYRYAAHPETIGPVRGPPPPFATANKPWTPAEEDPSGMAAQRDTLQAPVGANRDGGHCFYGETLRKTRSTPALTRTLALQPIEEDGKSMGERAKEAANPISIELNRWKRLAEVTKRDLASMPELHTTQKSIKPPPAKPIISGGLVTFPKYMLFENSHMKSMDFLRFVAAEDKVRAEAREREDRTSRGEPTPQMPSPPSTSRETFSSGDVPFQTASWGQPRRGPSEWMKQQWAGSSMPSGKNQGHSNRFRMG
jgi:hypothetical protein